MKNNTNFEFDSRCSDSSYVPAITAAIEKLDNSLLQQPDCTWAYLGNGKDGQEANRYLFWTSLNTDKVGDGHKIPVIIQTGDGKYYVSETTTGKRNGKNYVTVSESLTPNQYKQILKNGEQFSSLEAAYDAYLKALGDSKYDSVLSLKMFCSAIISNFGKNQDPKRNTDFTIKSFAVRTFNLGYPMLMKSLCSVQTVSSGSLYLYLQD